MAAVGSMTCTNSTFKPARGARLRRPGPYPVFGLVRPGPRTRPTYTFKEATMALSAKATFMRATCPRTHGQKCPVKAPRRLRGTFIRAVCMVTKCILLAATVGASGWRICTPMILRQIIGKSWTVRVEKRRVGDRRWWRKCTKTAFTFSEDTTAQLCVYSIRQLCLKMCV